MPTDNRAEPSVDYQIGAHDVDATAVSFGGGGEDDGEFIEFELEARAVFRRLADDIYESDKAGIREALTNAVTAVLKAENNHGLPAGEGVIEIRLHSDGTGGNRLVIQDNGVGITEDELREVVAVVGRSTTRDSGDLAGQFGMGFLALFKLVGTDGGFVMHTHARQDGEEPISGVWKSGGFARDTEGELPGGMSDDEYGTRFELHLKEDIDPDDVRDWVSDNAEWARRPVIYEEVDANDGVTFNEDYGGTSFDAHYDDAALVLSIDTPYFTAHCSTDPHKETILLDVPIRRNHGSISEAPWSSNVDIRLKNENGIVVDGPHEGLMPVNDREYQNMDRARQERYIPESNLNADDIVMPGPIGTRDKLGSADEFWEWLGNRFAAQYADTVRSLFNRIETVADLWTLNEDEYAFVLDAVPGDDDDDANDIQAELAGEYGIEISDELAAALEALHTTVAVAPRDVADLSQKSNLNREVAVSDIMYECRRDGRDSDIYVGKSLNKKKARVVWDDSDHNAVVHVSDTDLYEFYGNTLDWNLLKDIRKSRLDEFDIDDDVRALFGTASSRSSGSSTTSRGSNSSLPPRFENIVLHFGTANYHRKHTDPTEMREACKDAAKSQSNTRPSVQGKTAATLVAFPDSADRNVSDYYHLTDLGAAVFKCSDDAWSVLAGTPYIQHIDDYIEEAQTYPFETSAGTMTLADADDSLIFHKVDEEAIDHIGTREMMERVKRTLIDEPWDEYVFSWSGVPEDMVYAPVTSEVLYNIAPALADDQTILASGRWDKLGETQNAPSVAALYLHARLEGWRDTPEVRLVENAASGDIHDPESDISLMVELVERAIDAGVTPPSRG